MKDFIKKIILTCLIAFGFISCSDYLDLVPDDTPTIATVFENRNGALRYRVTLYSYLPNFQDFQRNPSQMSGDESWINDAAFDAFGGTKPGVIARGFQSVGSTAFDSWGRMYAGIRDCNVFLNEIGGAIDLTDLERKKWEAEAKTLKAYYHFYLMRMYGPIPIVKENLSVNSAPNEVQVARNSVDDVTNYIVELLDEALVDLPASLPNDESDYGMINKPVAAAIKARVLVTAASPLFNGNSDYASFVDAEGNNLINTTFDAIKWEKAATACKEAIDLAEAAGHALYTFNPAEVNETLSDTTLLKMAIRGSFTSRTSNEVIWAATGRLVSDQRRSMARLATPGATTFTLRNAIESFHAPTMRVAEMFYSENGVPINEDVNFDYSNRFTTTAASQEHLYYVQPNFVTAKLHLNREARFYASLGFDGNVWYGHGVPDDEDLLIVEAKQFQRAGLQDESGTIGYSATGYFAKKLAHYKTTINVNGARLGPETYAWPVIRLADLYLMYAEALNETSTGTPAPAVYEYVDKVRERAGLESVVSSWTTHSNLPNKPSTTEGMRAIIQKERTIELIFEGNRFWDLRRWKKASEAMNKPIRGWNINGQTTETYYNVQTLYQPTFSSKDYLWPISLTTVLRNKELIQNPGW